MREFRSSILGYLIDLESVSVSMVFLQRVRLQFFLVHGKIRELAPSARERRDPTFIKGYQGEGTAIIDDSCNKGDFWIVVYSPEFTFNT